jgi:type IV pilus assembly protein PilV
MHRQQSGIILIEALVSILIFSVGVLAIIALLTASVLTTRDSGNRSTAGLLASQVIGQMWVDDRTPANLQAKYMTGGTGYQTWLNNVDNSSLPGVSGVSANQPTIAISAVTATSSLVTVTVYWQPPDAVLKHKYVAITQID